MAVHDTMKQLHNAYRTDMKNINHGSFEGIMWRSAKLSQDI